MIEPALVLTDITQEHKLDQGNSPQNQKKAPSASGKDSENNK